MAGSLSPEKVFTEEEKSLLSDADDVYEALQGKEAFILSALGAQHQTEDRGSTQVGDTPRPRKALFSSPPAKKNEELERSYRAILAEIGMDDSSDGGKQGRRVDRQSGKGGMRGEAKARRGTKQSERSPSAKNEEEKKKLRLNAVENWRNAAGYGEEKTTDSTSSRKPRSQRGNKTRLTMPAENSTTTAQRDPFWDAADPSSRAPHMNGQQRAGTSLSARTRDAARLSPTPSEWRASQQHSVAMPMVSEVFVSRLRASLQSLQETSADVRRELQDLSDDIRRRLRTQQY
mmetsp:Transcript_32778/g.84659  ORF Transcript_32778/g.84659 Transcript_32778/m.84659 type:complete len:289 (-) Transcript_32778:151-1017(-)